MFSTATARHFHQLDGCFYPGYELPGNRAEFHDHASNHIYKHNPRRDLPSTRQDNQVNQRTSIQRTKPITQHNTTATMISIIDIFHDVWSITKGVFTSFLGSHLSTLLAQQLIMRALRDLAPVSTIPRKPSTLPAPPAHPAPAPVFNDPFAVDAPRISPKVHRDLTIAKVSYTPAPLMIFLLGAPGTGKGTQCAHLEEAFPCLTTLSFGDTLREFRVKDHPWVTPSRTSPPATPRNSRTTWPRTSCGSTSSRR